jgi:hypothetical protein
MYDIFSIVGAASLAVSGGVVLVEERLVPARRARGFNHALAIRPAGLAMPAPDADIVKGESLMCEESIE